MLETDILVVMETLLSSAPVLFAASSLRRALLYERIAAALELPFER